MKTIGLLSDTHGFIHPRVFDFFEPCDEIWHAGDIGNAETSDALSNFKPLRAVYGNIDGHVLRTMFPETIVFTIEKVKVVITHISGYPGKYAKGIPTLLQLHRPQLFIGGHSHILKVIYDQRNQLLFMNPGAAGKHGIHQKITFLKFQITDKRIHDLEILEMERKL